MDFSPHRGMHEGRSPSLQDTTMSSSHTQKNRGDSTPLPPINERLAFLRPPRELLEYYRKKIAEFDEEHEDLVKQLEQYKATFEEQVTIPQRAVQSGDPYARKLQRSGQAGTKQAPLKAPGKQDRSKEGKKEDPQILLLQVEALQAQLEEQTRLSKEQIETLLEDRKVRVEETQVQHQRDQDKMKSMTDKLNKTQKLLYESTRDFLQLK
ncbi:coiled-coil domain-containing protein 77-like isoform X1 [Xenopus tropicalis]|nr:coiled-coil domain-containing protein 77-like isoform X1 [Xenopus tropicalis]XP_031748069.1 coiled-coil domain-containing protein 77-like isoform X1 [Xenopus tropicalis]XP_031748070.1 coiled-coil domain-containing protein 77-like isoform X1 [Xenopus tropicalis]XP_031748074.1 coiled-coil domain-containing protein 77-like isoform X1 [Xenopus tropicalis]XP_031748075.1 coiled-coil domain-containing protein 77-like isoform X1 [Xenopus tropicalis]XP_031748076.1 coiled-coil domain-containing prote